MVEVGVDTSPSSSLVEDVVEDVVGVIVGAIVGAIVDDIVGLSVGVADVVDDGFDLVVRLGEVGGGVSNGILEKVPGRGKLIEELVCADVGDCLLPQIAITSLPFCAWSNNEVDPVLAKTHESRIFVSTSRILLMQVEEQVLPSPKSSMEQPRSGVLYAEAHPNGNDMVDIDSKFVRVKSEPDASTANSSTTHKVFARFNRLLAITATAQA
ncbi:hypothetical protein J3458_000976 [Metarhizium acridum]|uniref:Uncharacterized protein n=1 Tax=Metarhizium acridum (strain CQMa 102) TaxID=655827 RepID=E9DVI1_METAQ|nr:uncharacterized protein MAC_01629 [Metarhizium acridum CQMa 102]EFY92358.1 hypothetical protein MAC_01629 [Metarhizium acridum CQMa 102]KAG8424150.1 hypothetical protein J3458_000976 [Metarhizium acridum]